MTTVGVVGAGVMGTGVAQTLAQHGHKVILLDVDPALVETARARIRAGARMTRLLGDAGNGGSGGGRSSVDLNLIIGTTDYAGLGAVDFVIENVPEKWELKRDVWARLDRECPPAAVFAANTSAISITALAAQTSRPDRVLGMHFMNPVPLKPTVEVIRGWHTSPATLDRALGLLHDLGKEGVVVADSPGFVSNRVLMLTINEAIWLVQDGVAAAEAVDRIFTSCFGHPMGPLATADLIGLDTILYSIEVLHDSFCDGKYRPCPLLRQMVAAGRHGRKSGQGFFEYS